MSKVYYKTLNKSLKLFQLGGPIEDKRKVPPMLQKILHYDVQITKKFVEQALKTTALRSLRNHAKFLEVSKCSLDFGIVLSSALAGNFI